MQVFSYEKSNKKIKKKPQLVLIDGNKLPKIDNYNLKNIIKGDQKITIQKKYLQHQ